MHLAMKDAVIRCLVGDDRYWTESTIWHNTLRVDIEYTKNRRRFLVECETRPGIKRLIDKGKRRNRIPYRNVYLLVVPVERYHDVDWGCLRGYFDMVLAYDAELAVFTDRRDLRLLGPFRDAFLDVLMPIYESEELQALFTWLTIRKNCLIYGTRGFIQCSMCRLGLSSPWIFCPRNGCPHSISYTEYRNML